MSSLPEKEPIITTGSTFAFNSLYGMMSQLLATWTRLITIQVCNSATEGRSSDLPLSTALFLLDFHVPPTGYYFPCNQDAWSCFPQANTSSTLGIVFQDLSVQEDPNSIYHQLRKFQLRCKFPNEPTLDDSSTPTEEITNCLCEQSEQCSQWCESFKEQVL